MKYEKIRKKHIERYFCGMDINSGERENYLGKILMNVREEFKK